MPSISECPKCQRPVTIPDGLSPQAEVRCPLCAVVYPLGEAMAKLPPALVPVATGGITGRTGDPRPAAAGLISEPYGPPDVPATDARQPDDGGPALDVWKKADGAPRIDTGQTPIDADTMAGFEVKESDDDRLLDDGTSPGPPRRRKKKEKSAVRFMAEVFGGGIFGLLIGYYLLCWVGGSRFDLPELPLPLLPHTMHWFADAEQPDGDDAQQSPEGQPDAAEDQRPQQPETQQPPAKENNEAQPKTPTAKSPTTPG